MSDNGNNGNKATPWAKYRLARLAHTRELAESAAACREAPRCSACSIVLALRPDDPCRIAVCPLASSTSIVAPLSNATITTP
jgi:hypothetical protein